MVSLLSFCRWRGCALLLILPLLSACNAHTLLVRDTSPPETVEEPAVTQPMAIEQGLTFWRSCLSDGMKQDRLAREQASTGRYLSAARILGKCDVMLTDTLVEAFEPDDHDRRMKMLALSVMDFIQAGDVEAARRQLRRLTGHYRDRDLYFEDGASLIETLTFLINPQPVTDLANVGEAFRLEMRRRAYWAAN